jgi:hypothetical protein
LNHPSVAPSRTRTCMRLSEWLRFALQATGAATIPRRVVHSTPTAPLQWLPSPPTRLPLPIHTHTNVHIYTLKCQSKAHTHAWPHAGTHSPCQAACEFNTPLHQLALQHTFQRSKLSWEAATERLLDVSAIKPEEWPSHRQQRYDAMIWRMYRSVTGEAAPPGHGGHVPQPPESLKPRRPLVPCARTP